MIKSTHMKKITLIILLLFAAVTNAQEANYSIKNISENTIYSDYGVTYFGISFLFI